MRTAPLALLLLVPSVAFANDVDVDVHVDVNVHTGGGEPVVIVQPPPPRPVLRGSHWELGVFLEGGRIAIDDITGGQFGARGEVARQFGALRIGIEGSIAKFAASRDLYDDMGWWDGWDDVGGEVSRVGLTARLRSVHRTLPQPHMPNGADLAFYVEGGLGQQYIAWDGGGAYERNDFMLGVGFEIAGGQRRMGGMDLNVRAVVAPSLDESVETHDVSIIAGLGGRFGI